MNTSTGNPADPDLPPDFGNDALSIALADASKDDTVIKLVARCQQLEQERLELQGIIHILLANIGRTKERYEQWAEDTRMNVRNPVKQKERLRYCNKVIGTCQWLLSPRRIWNKAVKGYKPHGP